MTGAVLCRPVSKGAQNPGKESFLTLGNVYFSWYGQRFCFVKI